MYLESTLFLHPNKIADKVGSVANKKNTATTSVALYSSEKQTYALVSVC
jgi:hypothetical protein